MYVRVTGSEFKTATAYLVGSNGMETVNFFLQDGYLYLQTTGVVIANMRIPVKETDIKELNKSVGLDGTMQLLNTKQDVDISIQENILQITQGEFSYMAVERYEERVPNEAFTCNFDRSYDADEIRSFVSDIRAMDELSRTLAKGQASVSIKDCMAYIEYSNMAYTAPIRLPDMSITAEALKKIASAMGRSKVNACACVDNIMYIKISDVEVLTITIGPPTMQIVERIRRLIDEGVDVNTVNFEGYDGYMEAICKIYKKALIEFSICKGGLHLFINNASTRFSIGSTSNLLCTVKMSTPQLQAIQKLFGDCPSVTIQRGGNRICLRKAQAQRSLLIAGLVY